jgi:hypothetical protein
MSRTAIMTQKLRKNVAEPSTPSKSRLHDLLLPCWLLPRSSVVFYVPHRGTNIEGSIRRLQFYRIYPCFIMLCHRSLAPRRLLLASHQICTENMPRQCIIEWSAIALLYGYRLYIFRSSAHSQQRTLVPIPSCTCTALSAFRGESSERGSLPSMHHSSLRIRKWQVLHSRSI